MLKKWRNTLFDWLFSLAGKLKLRTLYHIIVDKVEGIDTAGDIPQHELSSGMVKGLKYGPGGWWDLWMTLGKQCFDNDVFLDMGSGKGRMVYLAARYYRFKRVIGVEISQKLNDIANKNIIKNKHKLRCNEIQLYTTDISNYSIPDDVTVIYMYDPFRDAPFVQMTQHLRESLSRRPRELRIIYRNPVMNDCLIENGFQVVLKNGSLYMYKETVKSPLF
jgi:SAM-dependent methyltransferase